MNINITIANKHCAVLGAPVIVCGNSDYTITFSFDDEWADATEKTARFVFCSEGVRQHQDVSFIGDTVAVPALSNTQEVKVGVYAGDLKTTAPARIPCELSILCLAAEEDRIQEAYNRGATDYQNAVEAVEAAVAKVDVAVAEVEDFSKYVGETVRYTEQPLTETQKAQARENIGAVDEEYVNAQIGEYFDYTFVDGKYVNGSSETTPTHASYAYAEVALKDAVRIEFPILTERANFSLVQFRNSAGKVLQGIESTESSGIVSVDVPKNSAVALINMTMENKDKFFVRTDVYSTVENIVSGLVKKNAELPVSAWESGKYISTGGTVRDSASYSLTDFIPVFPCPSVTAYMGLESSGAAWCAYDANKNFIKSYPCTEGMRTMVTVDTVGVHYMRFSSFTSEVANFKAYGLLDGSEVAHLSAEILAMMNANTPDTPGESSYPAYNMPVAAWESGKYIDTGGTLRSAGSYSLTDFVPVFPFASVDVYEGHSSAQAPLCCCYDENKNFIKSYMRNANYGGMTTIDTVGVHYIRVNCDTTNIANFRAIGTLDENVFKHLSAEIVDMINVEKPEDRPYPASNVPESGGYMAIFDRIGVVGDSLSSGTMSCASSTGNTKNPMMYNYSWIQYLGRMCGSTAINFSQGGLATDTFLANSGGLLDKLRDPENKCKCYFIALGHNDNNHDLPIGTSADIDLADYNNNANTYHGNYAGIIQRIKEVEPDAIIFPITMKLYWSEQDGWNAAIRYMAEIFDNVYVLDMYKYYRDIPDWHYTEGHGNAMGYLWYAKEIACYVDWLVRKNPEKFMYVQFIGTDYAEYIPQET